MEEDKKTFWACACLGPQDCTNEDCQIRKDYLEKQKCQNT